MRGPSHWTSLVVGFAGCAVALTAEAQTPAGQSTQAPQTPQTPQAPQAPQAPQTITPGASDPAQQQVRDQADQIRAQNARIDALEAKLRELTAIMSNRVDRIEAQTDSGKVIATNPGPRIEGPNARNSMTFIGAAQIDVGAVQQTDLGPLAPDVHSGSAIRRARLGIQGTAFSDFAYQVEIDLAGTGGVASNVKDVYVQYNGFRPVAFTIGNIKPRTGLETSFSDRSNAQTYMEGSMLSTMYTTTGTRNVGILASTGGEHWSGSLGWFGDDLNNNGVATAGEEGFGLHGRLTWAPIATKDALLHFGVSGFERKVSTDNTNTSQIRVRAQPENAIDAARLIDTGNITLADNANLIGLESAGFLGPVGFQSEWGQMEIDRIGRPTAKFSGAYVGANWFLTGESRVYDARTGLFTRFSPRVNADPKNGHWGAFELAARWSTLDLNSDPDLFTGATLLGIRGGEETNYTLGLNWYWNPYFRLMLNYVHAEAKNRTNTLPGIGADEGETLDLIGLRVQQEW